jgi:hypothetical protein
MLLIEAMSKLGFLAKTCKEGHFQDPSWKYCPICLAPVCGWLVGLDGELKNTVFTLHEGKSKIGSGTDCEVRIEAETISEYHTVITGKDGNYVITDANSVKGTYVNEKQIVNQAITDGDIIKMGDFSFKFKCL